MEAWIEDTLTQAEHFEIPSVIKKPSHKNPITRYGIDRLSLSKGGISDETIDRIYRSLFVHSVGFHELIKSCLQHTKGRYEHITSIWKVYSILLEYSCKSDYQMLVDEVTVQNEQKMKQMEQDHHNKLKEFKEDERIMKEEMDIMQKYSTVLEREKLDEKNFRMKLEEELLQNSKNHEEEVQLRLKFESKLNNMHSIHRDLGTKYRRALLDIETLQNTNELLNTKKIEIIQELNEIKVEFAEQETKLSYDREKIIALSRENEIKVNQVKELLEKTAEMQEKYDRLQYQYQLTLKNGSEQKLSIDVLNSQIQALKNEKTHLRQNEVESRMLKETFETKLNETTEELKTIKETLQISEREVLGFNEIRKEREERIEKLKQELDHLKVIHKKTDSNLARSTLDLEKANNQLETLKKEYAQVVEKLKKINKARNMVENDLENEKKLTKALKEELQSMRDTVKDRDKKINEHLETITEKEKHIHRITAEKITRDKAVSLEVNQYNEKIMNISSLLLTEQQDKQLWMEKFEKEQKDHATTSNALLVEKSTTKDLDLRISDLEIRLQSATRTSEHLQKTLQNMQEKANNFQNKFENSERALKTQTQQLNHANEKNQLLEENLEKLQKEHKEELKLVDNQDNMLYEDLLSAFANLRILNQEIQQKYEAEQNNAKELQDKLNEMEIDNNMKSEEITRLKEDITLVEEKVKEKTSRISTLDENIQKLMKIIEGMKEGKRQLEQSNIRLTVDLDKANEKMKALLKKNRKVKRTKNRNEDSLSKDRTSEGHSKDRSSDRTGPMVSRKRIHKVDTKAKKENQRPQEVKIENQNDRSESNISPRVQEKETSQERPIEEEKVKLNLGDVKEDNKGEGEGQEGEDGLEPLSVSQKQIVSRKQEKQGMMSPRSQLTLNEKTPLGKGMKLLILS